MQRRRVMLAGKRPRLPKEYQEVAFIRNHGTELLEIPLPTFSGTTIHYKVKYKLLSTVGQRIIIQVPECQLGFAISSYITLINYSSGAGRIKYPITSFDECDIDAWQSGNNLFLRVNGNSVSGQTTNLIFTQPYSLVCFGSKRVSNFGAIGEYEYVKAYMSTDESIPLCDLIPCYRKSDNEPGMYDLLGNAFYTNTGSGAFEVGPDVI